MGRVAGLPCGHPPNRVHSVSILRGMDLLLVLVVILVVVVAYRSYRWAVRRSPAPTASSGERFTTAKDLGSRAQGIDAKYSAGEQVDLTTEPIGDVVVESYPGRTQTDASSLFAERAQFMATRGYFPVSQSWGEGRPGVGRVLAIGLFATAIKPAGFLTVIYRKESSASAPDAGKTCPRCAETVKSAALVCRFCGHEFQTTVPAVPPRPRRRRSLRRAARQAPADVPRPSSDTTEDTEVTTAARARTQPTAPEPPPDGPESPPPEPEPAWDPAGPPGAPEPQSAPPPAPPPSGPPLPPPHAPQQPPTTPPQPTYSPPPPTWQPPAQGQPPQSQPPGQAPQPQGRGPWVPPPPRPPDRPRH